jgi:hypothetical protein
MSEMRSIRNIDDEEPSFSELLKTFSGGRELFRERLGSPAERRDKASDPQSAELWEAV